jgi:hypothetical protein
MQSRHTKPNPKQAGVGAVWVPVPRLCACPIHQQPIVKRIDCPVLIRAAHVLIRCLRARTHASLKHLLGIGEMQRAAPAHCRWRGEMQRAAPAHCLGVAMLTAWAKGLARLVEGDEVEVVAC